MLKSKRLFVVSGLIGLLAAMAFAAPSQASKAVCAVNGTAKTEDKDDPAFGVRLVAGKGHFAFTADVGEGLGISCVETEKQPSVVEFSATADGWFDNTVCGTGKAVGTVKTISVQKYAWLVGHRFAVEIEAFEGQFYWEASKTGKPGPEKLLTPVLNDEPSEGKDASGDWELAGNITLVAPNPENKPPGETGPVGNCTKAFDVVGSIIVHQP